MTSRARPGIPHSAPLRRRSALRIGLAGLALPPLLGSCSTVGNVLKGASNDSTEGSAGVVLESEAPLPEPFRAQLPIPPVAQPVRSDDADGGTDYYEITQKAAQAQILDGPSTEIWGYDGILPGPTIVSQRGRRTVVTHHNRLPVPVVVHLHGGRTAPEHDGYPIDLIMPEGHEDDPGDHGASDHGGDHDDHLAHGAIVVGSREYVYEMDQQAATLWYHDHRMDFTGPQVYRGLAGFHLVHDEDEAALGLPSGDRDVPLMIMDRAFAADGSFLYPSVDDSLEGTPGVTSEYMSGVLGDCILVNGAPWPVLEVSPTTYRFRLLNASNARRYRLRLEGGPQLHQIGSDMGLLEAPLPHDAIDIAQAERFDVIVDFSDYGPGEEITMVNELGADGTDQVMRFVVGDGADDGEGGGSIPERLVPMERLSADDVVAEREFVLERGGAEAHGMVLWTVNGEPFSPETIVARPELGTTEKWTIRGMNVEHPFHIHLAPFQVLSDDDGESPGPYDQGWKDTVSLSNGGRAELLIRFDGFRGTYVFHCHNLEHEDMMMMANFEVV